MTNRGSRPPEVALCPSCTPGERCEAHRVRVVCPGCGYEPCRPSCPRRSPSSQPHPDRRQSLSGTPPAVLVISPLEMMTWGRAWQLLEFAATQWLELRESVERDERQVSPTMLREAERKLARAAERVRAMRLGKPLPKELR